jgi:quercetin dioxygenase-like cupin family protein
LPIIDDRNFHEFFSGTFESCRAKIANIENEAGARCRRIRALLRGLTEREAEGRRMNISFVHSKGADGPITIPAIGLDLKVRMAPASSGGAFSITETINAPGKGPPRHRHPEAEIFRVLEGRYLYEMDSRRFYAEAGDVVSIPGGAGHGFVNVTNKPARQCILIVPALDAATFFTDLAARVLGVLFVLAGTLQEEISACVASLC